MAVKSLIRVRGDPAAEMPDGRAASHGKAAIWRPKEILGVGPSKAGSPHLPTAPLARRSGRRNTPVVTSQRGLALRFESMG
jgi:hypothetical protein